MSIGPTCLTGYQWKDDPVGYVGKLAQNDAYITGDCPDRGVLLIHDLHGWTFKNARLLADHYAREANATVYVPDFFGGKVFASEPLTIEKMQQEKLDLRGFMKPNSREIREPEIFECARAMREKHKKVGAVGFCFGGWAVFRLGAKEHQPPLVDCISTGHPTFLTKKDIDEVAVPVQILAPEFDNVYNQELKNHTFEVIPKLHLPFDYQFFPGVEHACFIRGHPDVEGERAAVERGKNSVVSWFREHL